jgi:hypothetical protein
MGQNKTILNILYNQGMKELIPWSQILLFKFFRIYFILNDLKGFESSFSKKCFA